MKAGGLHAISLNIHPKGRSIYKALWNYLKSVVELSTFNLDLVANFR